MQTKKLTPMARLSATISEEDKRCLDEACRISGKSQPQLIMEAANQIVGAKRNTLLDLKAKIEGNKKKIEQLQTEIREAENDSEKISQRFFETFDVWIEEERNSGSTKLAYIQASMLAAIKDKGINFEESWLKVQYEKYKQDNAPDLVVPSSVSKLAQS